MTTRYAPVSLEEVLPKKKSKLREEQIREIRELHRKGAAISRLAQVYYVSRPTIRSIIKGETWKKVGGVGGVD